MVGFAIVANVLGSKFTWPFFLIGFALACFDGIPMLVLCLIGVGLVWIYMSLQTKKEVSVTSDDPLGDILNDYE